MARPIKRTKTKMERLVRTVWRNTKKGTVIGTQAEKNVLSAINGTLFVLRVLDGQYGTNHKEYFSSRYLSLYNNKTQFGMAAKFKICIDTAGDYCAMYMKIFEDCLNLTSNLYKKDEFNSVINIEIMEVFTKIFAGEE